MRLQDAVNAVLTKIEKEQSKGTDCFPQINIKDLLKDYGFTIEDILHDRTGLKYKLMLNEHFKSVIEKAERSNKRRFYTCIDWPFLLEAGKKSEKETDIHEANLTTKTNP